MNELFQTNNATVSMAEVISSVSQTAAASPTDAAAQSIPPQDAAAQFLNDQAGYQDITDNTFTEQPQPLPGGPQAQNIGQYIPAPVAVELFDSAMSKVVLMAAKAMKLDITKTQAKATADEKRLLEQPMEEVLKASNIRITNPFEAFAFAAVTIYGGKLMMAYFSNAFEEAETVETPESDLNVVAQKAKRKNKPGAGRPRKNVQI